MLYQLATPADVTLCICTGWCFIRGTAKTQKVEDNILLILHLITLDNTSQLNINKRSLW